MVDKKQKVAVLGGMPICATEIHAIFARVMNPNPDKLSRTNKSDRKRNRINRWR